MSGSGQADDRRGAVALGRRTVTDLAEHVPPPAHHLTRIERGARVMIPGRQAADPGDSSDDAGTTPILDRPVAKLARAVVSPARGRAVFQQGAAMKTADGDRLDA